MKGAQPSQPVSDRIAELCASTDSVSSLLAADPSLAPGDAWHKLYGHHMSKPERSMGVDHAGEGEGEGKGKGEVPDETVDKARKCGKWGPTEPSDLFLRMYNDALVTLDENLGHGMCSPSLMGSCGVMPLTIISVVPDIVRHMANVIVRAEREVYLATNYWQNSVASRYITNAMRELSRRAGDRGTKIVMKIIYDRGSPKQLIEPHYMVPEKEFTSKAVGIPALSEIPNVDLQVMNFHTPMMGTFHAKYMVVDRRIGILQSNNIQDNDNVEMMVHLEGPIVDSLYDMALISWHKRLEPPLPSLDSPAVHHGGVGSLGRSHEAIFGPGGEIKGHRAIVDPSKMPPRESYGYEKGETRTRQPGLATEDHGVKESDGHHHRGDILLTDPTTTHGIIHPHAASAEDPGQTTNEKAMQNLTIEDDDSSSNQPPQGEKLSSPAETAPSGPDADADAATATSAILARGGSQPIPQPQIAEPSPAHDQLPEHTSESEHYDADIAGEIARVQAAVSAKPGVETRMQAVTRHLNHTTNNEGCTGDAPECADAEEMTPYIPHPAHEPFPIAMVCRSPYGHPNHKSVRQPQNAAWLSALRNARKNVFIQSPTLNAEPLLPAIVAACERGVDVYCYICLGYNDTGELLPMQGGHNDMIAHKLYASLSSPEARARLHYFWYVAKDQTKPVVQAKKKRSCHVKLMIADEHVGIVGNGNQDTQSWYHSQEINVMTDSADVCKAWIDGLRRNQNTHRYGALSKEDGIWRDKDGKEADGAIGIDPGRFSWARGFVGAIRRVQGTGGF